jgi:hypothetical protein
MPASALIRKYFSAYENKIVKPPNLYRATTSYLPFHTNVALTVKPISNGVGPMARNPQRMALRTCLRNATKLSSSTIAKPRMATALGTHTIEGSKIKEIEIDFGSAPTEPT